MSRSLTGYCAADGWRCPRRSPRPRPPARWCASLPCAVGTAVRAQPARPGQRRRSGSRPCRQPTSGRFFDGLHTTPLGQSNQRVSTSPCLGSGRC
jgi:hypothetical protein